MLTTQDKIEAVKIAAIAVNNQDRVTVSQITSAVKEVLIQTEAAST